MQYVFDVFAGLRRVLLGVSLVIAPVERGLRSDRLAERPAQSRR